MAKNKPLIMSVTPVRDDFTELTFFNKARNSYPTILTHYGVPERKVTGPRVAIALAALKKDLGGTKALEIARQFIDWSKKKHKHYNIGGVLSIVTELSAEIERLKPAVSKEESSLKKVYYSTPYAPDHWALQTHTLDDPKMVALAYFKGSEYAVYMNPTDQRGYRSIVMLINNADMKSTFNRDYTHKERIGLGILTELVADAYTQIVPISQTALMGNNSQEFDRATGAICLGTEIEPSLLHVHVMGRGNPSVAYVDGIPLDGPEPGIAFLFKSSNPDVPGNNKNVPWKEGDMEKVVARLRVEIKKISADYTEQGLSIVTTLQGSLENETSSTPGCS